MRPVDVARLAGMSKDGLWLLQSGTRAVRHQHLEPLARALMLHPQEFFLPIGSPIPPPLGMAAETSAFNRLQAMLTALELGLEPVMRFVFDGDASALPPRLAHRIREVLEQDAPQPE